MDEEGLQVLPSAQRETARSALEAAFGSNVDVTLRLLRGGASGASLCRLDASGRAYVLRLEAPRTEHRNPHRYACMRTAAEAGIAPALLYVDEEAGVTIMDHVPAQPLAAYPGGPGALAKALGGLTARLQETDCFPRLHDYPAFLERMIGLLAGPAYFAEGLLAPHREVFDRIRDAYPWSASAPVSAHNDPNPHNVIFDGDRLWLIDWETAFCNEPLVDVAILADNFAREPELERVLLEAWLGGPADREVRARLLLMRLFTRLYYASLLLWIGRTRGCRAAPEADLAAPTPAELAAGVADGTLQADSAETMWMLGKMALASFLAGSSAPGFEQAVAIVGA